MSAVRVSEYGWPLLRPGDMISMPGGKGLPRLSTPKLLSSGGITDGAHMDTRRSFGRLFNRIAAAARRWAAQLNPRPADATIPPLQPVRLLAKAEPIRPTQRSMPSSSPRTGMTGSNSIPAGACGSWHPRASHRCLRHRLRFPARRLPSERANRRQQFPRRAHQPQQRYSQPGTALPGTRAEGSNPLGEVPASG